MRKPSVKRAVPLEGLVTSLVPRNRRPDRLAVYIDGSYALEVDAGLAGSTGLRVGEVLSAEARQRLVESDVPYLARARALGLLALRDRSSDELRTRLRVTGFEPPVVEEVVLWLKDLGYLDDQRFAESYALEKLRSGWGERRVRQELLRKRVDRAFVDHALASHSADEESAQERSEALRQLVRRRFGAGFKTDPEGAERRLTGFLARRGYDWDSIGQMVRMLRSEAEETA